MKTDGINILLVEDEKDLSLIIRNTLTGEGFNVRTAYDGEEGLRMFYAEKPDVLVADVMLPKMIGFDVCRTLREKGSSVPVIILTAREEEADKVLGLETGADDYMTKPVNDQELLLRIKALLRRANIISEQKLTIGAVTLDYSSLSVARGTEQHTLPKKEFYLLFKLLSCPDKIFTRIQLMDEIWGMNSNSVDTTINVHINRLRKRFGDYPEFRIVAIKGIGYKAVINQ